MKSRDVDKRPLSYDINYISDATFRNNLQGDSLACESEDTAAHFLNPNRTTSLMLCVSNKRNILLLSLQYLHREDV